MQMLESCGQVILSEEGIAIQQSFGMFLIIPRWSNLYKRL
jgi:hypothetical protein